MTCAFCGASMPPASAVNVVLTRHAEGYSWFTADALVACASRVDGSWRLSDCRGRHVVTMVGLTNGRGHALVGPDASLIGSIRPHEGATEGPTMASVAADPDGETVLVLRSDAAQDAHLVDRRGDVVALLSWDRAGSGMKLMVTPLGTRHPLSMVFGLVLSLELGRQAPPAGGPAGAPAPRSGRS